jgi:hypothetical protein
MTPACSQSSEHLSNALPLPQQVEHETPSALRPAKLQSAGAAHLVHVQPQPVKGQAAVQRGQLLLPPALALRAREVRVVRGARPHLGARAARAPVRSAARMRWRGALSVHPTLEHHAGTGPTHAPLARVQRRASQKRCVHALERCPLSASHAGASCWNGPSICFACMRACSAVPASCTAAPQHDNDAHEKSGRSAT